MNRKQIMFGIFAWLAGYCLLNLFLVWGGIPLSITLYATTLAFGISLILILVVVGCIKVFDWLGEH
jgi:hypothetical protein